MNRFGGTRACGGASTASPIVVHITSTVVTAASGTKYTPSGNPGTDWCATAIASRVLPDPPGPVNVTNRTPAEPTRAVSSATSPSRPTSGVAGRGRLVAVPSDFNGGKSRTNPSPASWNSRSGWARSFNWCNPRSTSCTPSSPARSTSRAVASDTTTCPPCAAAAIRAARCTSIPT